MAPKEKEYLSTITNRIREFTTNFIPTGYENYKLPIDAKRYLINSGDCVRFAKEFLKTLDLNLIGKYVNVYEWESIHTFMVINNKIYDAMIWAGISIGNNREKINQYFLKWSAGFEFSLNEHYYIHNEKTGYIFNFDDKNDFNIECIETIYTVDEFLNKK